MEQQTSSVLQLTAVTGGSGYLGQAVTRRLLELGVPTRIIDTKVPSPDLEGAKFVRCDIREPASVAGALQGVQTVIHLAGLIDIRRCYHPTASREVNVQGTANVVRASRGAGVKRMVYVSTSNVLMEEKECLDIDEETVPPCPCNEYSRTKLEAEALVLAEAAREDGLLVTVLRPPWIWGPGESNFWVVADNPLPMAVRTGYCNGIYLRNAANVLVHAASRLRDRKSPSHGQALFIKDPTSKSSNGLLHCQLLYRCKVAGRSVPESFDIPFSVLLWAAWLADLFCSIVWLVFRVHLQRGDGFTQYAIWAGFGHHTFCDRRAREVLGQWPEVSVDQAIQETRSHYFAGDAVVQALLSKPNVVGCAV
ncbi:sdr42e1 [Symbiodinium necroappetens]|uniref:Sdr42e1 protein n=1 Tax=Symbiodinium necroappetens TaxID=1628268 RepID=A0A812WBT3_9DINO|nr:sdr42e1 [Symbiodinium necroappetens]